VGMEGAELLEATNLREKEDEEDARREEEAQADLLDGS
jgi:coiled-coil domain-containing protein 12